MKKLFLLIFITVFLFACGGDEKIQEDDLLNDFSSGQSQVVVSESIIEEMIHSIPSPIEMTSLIKSTGVEFNEQILNDPGEVDKYVSAHSKALNLGIFGAELGYLNIYGKTMVSVDHLSAVRSLAKDLKIDQFFDFSMLKRLAESSDNIDSLMTITTRSFGSMESYLREQNRTKASVMIVTGTFIEGLYIATQIVKEKKDSGLVERIGEQKISVDNLILMLRVYKDDPEVALLATHFNELKVLYDKVQIITTYGEPVAKEVDGILVIEDNSNSEIVMDDELLDEIIMKTKEIRSKLI